jgi:hypothetical protein
MNLSDTVSLEGRHPDPYGEMNTRLSGRWLFWVRAIWTVLVVFALIVVAVSIPQFPVFFRFLQQPCIGNACAHNDGQLSLSTHQAFARLGISPWMFALFAVATIAFIPALVWMVVGMVLFWRRSDDWMALLTSLLLIYWGASFATGVGNFVPSTPIWQFSYSLIQTLVQALLFLFFCLFPNGRFVPNWAVWLTIIGFLIAPFSGFHGLLPSINWLLSEPVFFLLIAAVLGTQIYRYVYVSTRMERQQAKWLIFGLSVVFLVDIVAINVLDNIFAWMKEPGSFAAAFFNTILWALLFMSIPISIGIAMLRYRLWDIDRVINRTLVYGLLTGILILVYALCVLISQSILSGLVGGSGVAIVGSTLAIYALFLPLRNRIQRVIDRRFYRRKYDAAKTLAEFSSTLRSEVDLQPLSEQLVDVVQETMQPTFVSLWLRPSEQTGAKWNSEDSNTK